MNASAVRTSSISHDPVLNNLIDELTAKLQAGESVDVEALASEHPAHADALRRLVPALQVLADLSRHSEPQPIASGEPSSELGELGDFRLIREIGRGGMGIVYEAEQISLNRNVALKVLPFAATMDPRHLQRFRNEAQAAACLHHPNIVPVHGVGCDRGVHYYAMQLIEGQTLAEVIHSQRSPGLEDSTGVKVRHPSGVSSPEGDGTGASGEALRTRGSETKPNALLSTKRDRAHFRHIATLIASAADALEYAHSMGVVHRDIKPGNLMLDFASPLPTSGRAAGGEGHLWITDFGLAKLANPAASLRREPGELTLTGDLIGTLRYMSPEQALAKHGLVDHRTDIYSLGATLYELLTLQPAVAGADKAEILKSIAWEEPTPLRKHDKSIPAELETITLKCLAKEPSERYATAGELAEDLRHWLADKPIKAKPAGWREKAAKWGRRHRSVVVASVMFLTMAVIGMAAFTIVILKQQRQIENALGLAQSNLAHADKQRQRAWQAADDMYTQVAQKWLKGEPKLTELQREFLEKALKTYEEISNEAVVSPDMVVQRAKARGRYANILTRLERRAEADKVYLQAIGELEQVDIETATSQLAELYDSYGLLLGRIKGRETDSFAAASKSVALWEALPVHLATRPENRRGRARALTDLCAAFIRRDRLAECEPRFHQGSELLRGLILEFPENVEYRWVFGGLLNNYALAISGAGDHGRACQILDEAIRHQTEAVRLAPREPDYRWFLRNHYQALAEALRQLQRSQDSLEASTKSLEITRQLAADFPNVPHFQRCIAETLSGYGETQADLKEYTKALEAFKEAVSIQDRLLASDPTSSIDRSIAGRVRVQLGGALYATHRFGEAIDYYKTGFDLAENIDNGHRLFAACAAAQAGCGNGMDANLLDADKRQELRLLSLNWLTDAIESLARDKSPAAQSTLDQHLHKLQTIHDLSEVRDPAALAKLPEPERARWTKLWNDISRMRMNIEKGVPTDSVK